jgi:membrane protein implicated in regulation of membrane protease activity
VEDAVNPYQSPDGDFAAPAPGAPRPGDGPIVLRGPYGDEELDYESPEVEVSIVSGGAATITLLILLASIVLPMGEKLLFLAPVFALVWVVALWVERSDQRAAEASFRDQRLDLMEQIAVDEAGVSVTIEGEVSLAPWDRFETATEEAERLILRGPSWFWLPLPKRRLVNAGDWERLVTLVREKLPKSDSTRGAEEGEPQRHRDTGEERTTESNS